MTEVIQLICIAAQVGVFYGKQGREQFCIRIAEGQAALLVPNLRRRRIAGSLLNLFCRQSFLFPKVKEKKVLQARVFIIR